MTQLQIEHACGFWARLRGLIGRPPLAAHRALLLRRCRAIHTFFMNAPIDVVFLDRFGKVLKIVESLRPWRVAACAGCEAVLELADKQARAHGLFRGTAIKV
jgi:uncharacterized membrane protein (UPF0127 family)